MIPYAREERRGKRRAGQPPLISMKESGGNDDHEEGRKREKNERKGEIGGSGFKSLLKRWIDVPTNGSCLPRLLSSSRFISFFCYRSCSFNAGLTGLLSSAGIGRLPCGRDWSKLTRWNNEWPLSWTRYALFVHVSPCYIVNLVFVSHLPPLVLAPGLPKIKSNRIKHKLPPKLDGEAIAVYRCKMIATILPSYAAYAFTTGFFRCRICSGR